MGVSTAGKLVMLTAYELPTNQWNYDSRKMGPGTRFWNRERQITPVSEAGPVDTDILSINLA